MKSVKLLLLPFTALMIFDAEARQEVYEANKAADRNLIRGDLAASEPYLKKIIAIREASNRGQYGSGEDDAGTTLYFLAASRLFYIELTRDRFDVALEYMKLAIEIEEESGRFEMPNLEIHEKLLLALERWLAWDTKITADLDRSLVYSFYKSYDVANAKE